MLITKAIFFHVYLIKSFIRQKLTYYIMLALVQIDSYGNLDTFESLIHGQI